MTYARIDGLQTLAGQQKAVVTVYSLDHFIGFLGASFLTGFHASFPDITLSVVDTSDDRALDMLRGGKADFAIVNGPIDHTRFMATELLFSRYCFRINLDNPLSRKPHLTVKDLNGQTVVGKGREYNCFRNYIDQMILKHGIHIDIPIETSDEELLMELVENNVAIAGTYEFSALTHCGPNSVIRFLDDPNNGQMMYLVERYSTPPTRAGRCFKTYLLDWIQGHRSQLTEQTSQF